MHSGKSEGMFTNYTFLANQTYRISILFRQDNANGTFWVLAANNLTNTSTACGNPDTFVPDRAGIGAFSGPMNDVSQSLYYEFTPDKGLFPDLALPIFRRTTV